MKCKICVSKDNCSLREMATDITGCDGHSKEKPVIDGYIQCSDCKTWVEPNIVIFFKDGKKHLCLDCY